MVNTADFMTYKKTVAAIQSNYIPWKGYFDAISMVDEFVFYDDVQYTKNDWRNRNKIKTPQGIQWLTIPVIHESLSQRVRDAKIAKDNWSRKHWNAITINYSKAKYFDEYQEIFSKLYGNLAAEYLCEVNYLFVETICKILGIKTKLTRINQFTLSGDKTEKLVDLSKQLKATHYLTGPSAKGYIEEDLFTKKDIVVEYMNYANYPEYSQLYGPFIHEVSVLDLIFNEGPNAIKFMQSSKLVSVK